MSRVHHRMSLRILLTAILLLALHFLAEGSHPLSAWILYLIPYAIIGWDVLWRAVRNIARGQVFDENFLMALATVGAFLTGAYDEAVFVLLFYQAGELFQSYAVGKSRRSIAALMDIRPDSANLEGEDGVLREVDPEDVAVGSIIVVKPGERVPLDGTVLEGVSTLDTASLTGESLPRDVAPGDDVLSGCVNQKGLLRVQVTRESEESTVSRILDLVENASERKSRSERFITRFARWYTPCVVGTAAILFTLPSLLLALMDPSVLPGFLAGTSWGDWLHRALIFLVVSCPCALVISVPLSFFGGIGGAGRCGILMKGGVDLEVLAQTDTVVFDKTGTLTSGAFSVTNVQPEAGFTEASLLDLAALAESWSDHPISQSLKAAAPKQDLHRLGQTEELSGYGVRAEIDGMQVLLGNQRLMEQEGIPWKPVSQAGTTVHVAVDGAYAGQILLCDQPKEEAKSALAALRRAGVKRIAMLTGDTEPVARSVAEELGLDSYRAELLPDQKVQAVEELMEEFDGKLAFVGDGINDAPVLTRADVGIAMGALGSDAAIEAADIVLMDDRLSKLSTAMGISRKTLQIVRENIVFALGVKGLVLILGAMGYASMWAAVFADVGVAFLAILNAMRCLRAPNAK